MLPRGRSVIARFLVPGLLLGTSALCSHTAAAPPADTTRIEAPDPASLQRQLLALADRRLAAAGLSLQDRQARLSLSGPLPPGGAFDVRPVWPVPEDPSDVPPLPLGFELWPVTADDASERGANRPIQALLAAPVLREVWVAARRLRKGSSVRCEDFETRQLDSRRVSPRALRGSCALPVDAVAWRELAAGDVIRSDDVGKAPDVSAGDPVQLRVVSGGVRVMVPATALADARTGDRIDVRLHDPQRIFRTRVVGPGQVELPETPQ